MPFRTKFLLLFILAASVSPLEAWSKPKPIPPVAPPAKTQLFPTEIVPPTAGQTTPFEIRGITGRIAQLAAGHPHCALLETGKIQCWVSVDQFRSQVTPFVVFDDKFQFLEAGARHGCGITVTGELRCWGSNTWGELGAGDFEALAGRPPMTAIHVAVGENFTCAISGEGRVHCWGRNDRLQLGTAGNEDSEPCKSMGCRRDPGPEVKLPGKAIQVAAGKTHACAILEDGSVRCWGENTFGQLGTRRSDRCPGERKYKNSCLEQAVEVEQLGGKAKALRAGTHFTCAILESGEVRCWGIGTLGQYGTAQGSLCVEPITGKRNIPCSPKPIKIEGLPKPARSLAVGDAHACVVLENSEAWCWGGNAYGELGDESVKSRPEPKPVKHLGPTVEQISLSLRRSCAMTSDNRVFCWPQPRLISR